MEVFVKIFGCLRLCSLAVVLGALAAPQTAAADDTLTLVSGAFPTAFPEVLNAVAERAGFYRDEHLNVITQYAGGAATLAVQAVGSGKGDIAGVGTEPIIQGYEKGVRLMAFFSRNPHLQQVLGVLDSSPIRTLADFKGATIGQLALGQPGTIYTSVMLAGAGLKKDDYSFVAIGNGPQAIQAITSKRVDAVAFPEPELRTYEVAAHLKFRYYYQPILKDISDVSFVAAPATIAAKADAFRRFCRAIVKASILTRVNPPLAARYFVEASGLKVTDEAIANERHLLEISQDMLPAGDPSSRRIGEVSIRGMQVLDNFMYDNAMTSIRVPATAIATNQFIDFANDFDRAAFIAKVKAMH
jgi:NitT/TauT family transport system substrate-binding protein